MSIRIAQARAPYVGKTGAAPGPGVDEKVKVSGADGLTDFLANKVAAGAGIILTVLPGVSEQLQISVDLNWLEDLIDEDCDDQMVSITGNDQTTGYLFAKVMAGSSNVLLSVVNPGGIELMQIDISTTPQFDIVYLGPPNTNGSWRIRESGGELAFENRVGGMWIQKGSVSP
jgi:hypothetical protein